MLTGAPALDLSDDVHEFLEIQNAGAVEVSLAGWELAGGADFTFPAGAALPAGDFTVIAKNPARISAVYGLPQSSIYDPYSGKLGNDGDTVSVRTAMKSCCRPWMGRDTPLTIAIR